MSALDKFMHIYRDGIGYEQATAELRELRERIKAQDMELVFLRAELYSLKHNNDWGGYTHPTPPAQEDK